MSEMYTTCEAIRVRDAQGHYFLRMELPEGVLYYDVSLFGRIIPIQFIPTQPIKETK